MNPAQKALWFIESHLASELTLDEIAAWSGLSNDEKRAVLAQLPARRTAR